MELQYTRQEKIAGLFIVFVLILLLATLIVIGRGKDWFKSYATYYTLLDESYNLKENASVKLLNAEIGKVDKIFIENDRVKIKLEILKEYTARIRKDAVATVESPTFIGSEFISIKPGSSTSPLIPEGGIIPSRPRRSLSDIIAEFEVEKTAKMLIAAIQEVTLSAKRISDPNGPLFTTITGLSRTVKDINRILRRIESGEGTLGDLVTSKRIANQVHKNLEELSPVIRNTERITGELPGVISGLKKNLSNFDNLAVQLGPILDSVDRTAEKAPATVELLKENLTLLKRVQSELIPRIEESRQIISDVTASVEKIRSVTEKAAPQVPEIVASIKDRILELRTVLGNLDDILLSLKKSFLIRGNLPAVPKELDMGGGLRE